MSTALRHEPLYGLVELDAEGRVLYYNPEKDGDALSPKPDIVGQNFFDEVAKFDGVRELQQRINSFRLSHAPALSFNFDFRFDRASYPARILLARIHDRSELGRQESVFVHIRKG
ncbi:MAG TPA: hypothetical protein VF666_18895 [Pyrinomonadaceae bacterium]|jgi:hypothetical protein